MLDISVLQNSYATLKINSLYVNVSVHACVSSRSRAASVSNILCLFLCGRGSSEQKTQVILQSAHAPTPNSPGVIALHETHLVHYVGAEI